MGLLNTGMNALGTYAVLKTLFGRKPRPVQKGVQRFLTEIGRSGVGRTNYFDVTITPPPIFRGSQKLESSIDLSRLSLYADGVSLPGLNIQTDSFKRYGIGPTENVPYSTQYNDITINFIADGKGEIYKFFYNWMQGIIPTDQDIRGGKLSATGLAPYEVEFKDRYSTTITITTWNEQDNVILVYDIYDAFPKTVPDIQLSWKDSDGYMQFGITFCYFNTKLVNATEVFEGGKNSFGGLSALQKAIKLGTALQTLKSLKRPRSVQDALASSTTFNNVFR